MPERAEIEAVAEVLAWEFGISDRPSRRIIDASGKAIAALDRVRDARGDDKAARWIEPHDALKYELGDPMDDERVARSPQDEDHDQPFSGQAADDIVESQSEDHEAGIEMAHRLVAAYEDRIARLKTAVRVGMPADIAIGADVKLSIAMDKDRDAISRMLPKGGLGQ